MDLDSLLLNLGGMAAHQIEAHAIGEYVRLYINAGNYGRHTAHDGTEVVFWKDRFEHAFKTSSNRARYAYLKDILAIDRIERMQWIGAVIAGKVPDSECWEVAGEGNRRHPPNRLYIVWPKLYVVWLEPRKESGWKFASAYSPSTADIRRYIRGARKIWKFGG